MNILLYLCRPLAKYGLEQNLCEEMTELVCV
jgi:hypothetical protein